MAVLATARMAAFSPGQSPPPVRMPILRTRFSAAMTRPRAREDAFDELRQVAHEGEREGAAQRRGDLLEVLAVPGREYDPFQAGATGGQHLLLDPAHREHLARERELPGHRRVGGEGPAREQGDERGVAIAADGPTWQAMRLSRNRNWGHPELVGFLIGLSQGISAPVLMGLSIKRMPETQRTTAMGIHPSIYAFGMFAGPAVSGVLSRAMGIRTTLGVTGAAVLVVGIRLTGLMSGLRAEKG